MVGEATPAWITETSSHSKISTPVRHERLFRLVSKSATDIRRSVRQEAIRENLRYATQKSRKADVWCGLIASF